MRALEHNPPLPTAWSFVPVGLLAPAALLVSMAWREPVRPDGYVESSIWAFYFLGWHLLALVGCARGCILFMWRRGRALTRREAFLPCSFLVVAIGWLVSWGLLLWRIAQLSGVALESTRV